MEKLRGSLKIEHTLADHGARKLWQLMKEEPHVPALGALTGNQAIQMVKGGLKAIYCSGWQVGLCSHAFQLFKHKSHEMGQRRCMTALVMPPHIASVMLLHSNMSYVRRYTLACFGP